MTKVSVAMATYNGERYIAEQLASIAGQTRPPDEIVICDDVSTDQTVSIVNDFAGRRSIDVRVYVNDERLGVRGNFERALGLCTGEVIFLSDQDDVWLPGKIEAVLHAYGADPRAMVTINDMILADSALRPAGPTAISQTRSVWGMSLDQYVPGCATSIRAEIRDLVLPIPLAIPHDTWIHQIALALDQRIVIDSVLQVYRRHDANHSNSLASTVGVIPLTQMLFRLFEHDACESADARASKIRHTLQRLEEGAASGHLAIDPVSLVRIMAALEADSKAALSRSQLLRKPRQRRFIEIWRLLRAGGYKYFGGLPSAIKDAVSNPMRPRLAIDNSDDHPIP